MHTFYPGHPKDTLAISLPSEPGIYPKARGTPEKEWDPLSVGRVTIITNSPSALLGMGVPDVCVPADVRSTQEHPTPFRQLFGPRHVKVIQALKKYQ